MTWITDAVDTACNLSAGCDDRFPYRRIDMQNHDSEHSERSRPLSDDDLDAVSGGDSQVAHLPQSIHMDYGALSIDENPTRLA